MLESKLLNNSFKRYSKEFYAILSGSQPNMSNIPAQQFGLNFIMGRFSCQISPFQFSPYQVLSFYFTGVQQGIRGTGQEAARNYFFLGSGWARPRLQNFFFMVRTSCYMIIILSLEKSFNFYSNMNPYLDAHKKEHQNCFLIIRKDPDSRPKVRATPFLGLSSDMCLLCGFSRKKFAKLQNNIFHYFLAANSEATDKGAKMQNNIILVTKLYDFGRQYLLLSNKDIFKRIMTGNGYPVLMGTYGKFLDAFSVHIYPRGTKNSIKLKAKGLKTQTMAYSYPFDSYSQYFYPFLSENYNYGSYYPFLQSIPVPYTAMPTTSTTSDKVKVPEDDEEWTPKYHTQPIQPAQRETRVLETDYSSEDKLSKKNTVAQKSQTRQTDHKYKADIKLDFRIEWKNENRNIVPNLINQLVSFLLKKIKSYKIVKRIFASLPHDPSWTEKRFYLYMKKIKESVTHYVNENVITRFLEIHEPNCELYDYDEQLFYMKITRIAILHFLKDDAVLISLTSNRMSHSKRMIHLIARDALIRKFLELCRNAKQ